ncbi:cytochrome c oxidase subunit II [Sphingomonas sp. CROZ-RG-20F-R02-07]|uniref:cytochrome c oxidase subunit II n=1 Tax=Sphingomonas sp. CROZ-RG-20F-R02-07 TaxID=2914832 RepID=UPI001F567CBD|nr:cytochrome c oxidase subunit II [Sphingomonas sp. CROZ-RG-20F-R02-07]
MTLSPSQDAMSARWPLEYLTSAGPHAAPVVPLTWFLLGISAAVILIFTVAVAWGIIVRRQRVSRESLSTCSVENSSRGLSWVYIGMPLTLVTLIVALFWTMLVTGQIAQPASPPTLAITVTGRQWWWQVNYPALPGGRPFETANEIHIPVGQPVLVRLRGGDVIHSFWVPALAGKTDTIPGRQNVTWLQADRPGVYRGQCTEYCGAQHANMGFLVFADPPAVFAAWRRNQDRLASAVPARPTTPRGMNAAANDATRPALEGGNGQAIFAQHCGGCHAIDGTDAHGYQPDGHGVRAPNLTHLMSRRTLAAVTLTNNTNNLAGWISDPQAQKPGVRMPITHLSGPELQAVVAYLKAQQ